MPPPTVITQPSPTSGPTLTPAPPATESSASPTVLPAATPASRQSTFTPAPTPLPPTSTPRPPTPTPIPTPTPSSTNPPLGRIKLVNAFPDLPPGAFGQRPLYLAPVTDGTGRLVVLSQKGEIRIIANDGSARAPVFLDLSNRVSTRNNEEGLLGLAFHPNYRNTGYFYVFYSSNKGPRHNVLSRFKVTTNPDQADPASEVELLAVPKNFGNHNGGMLAFGPDGYLYLSLGDGGWRRRP